METKSKHTHEYKKGKGSVDVCSCGRFQFNEKSGPAIVEIPAPNVYTVLECAERGLEFYSKGGTYQHHKEVLEKTRPMIEYAPDLLEFCEKVSRSVCLKQFSGDRCICFACEAGRLISKAEGGK